MDKQAGVNHVYFTEANFFVLGRDFVCYFAFLSCKFSLE